MFFFLDQVENLKTGYEFITKWIVVEGIFFSFRL